MKKELFAKAIKYLSDSAYRTRINIGLGIYDRMPDDDFLKMAFSANMEYSLDLENPRTFNEKLQWLKLYNRRPEYTMMVDKYRVRDYIKEKLGEEYLIPLIGVWDAPDDIDFDALPEKFVLKCNHNSGLGMCICSDKSKLDIKKVKQGLARGLKQDYYLTRREWPYKDVPRRIIAEQYMADGGNELSDYKIHSFNGVPKVILVCRDRFASSGLTEDFFTDTWEHLDIRRTNQPNSTTEIEKPAELDEMLELSRVLSKDIPFVRTDFYVVNHKVYFGELTFFPASGLVGFVPSGWDETLGRWLKLPITESDPVQRK